MTEAGRTARSRWSPVQSALDYIDHAALRDALNRGLRTANIQREQQSARLSDFAKDLPARLSQAQEETAGKLRDHVYGEIATATAQIAGLASKTGALEENLGRHIQSGTQATDRISSELSALQSRIAGIDAAVESVKDRSARTEGRLEALLDATRGLGEKLDSTTRAIIEKNELLSQAILQLSQVAERSDSRLDRIEQAIGQMDQIQAARHEHGVAATSANSAMIARLQGSIEDMAQLAVLWAETGTLHEAAQSQAQARMQRDIEQIKRHSLGDAGMPVGTDSAPLRLETRQTADSSPTDKSSVWRVVRKGAGTQQTAIASTDRRSGTTARRAVEPELIADETFSATWDGLGWPTGKAALDPGGIVRATGDTGAGFVTRKYPFAEGGLLEIEIEMAGERAGSPGPVLSIVSDADEGIGPETALEPGITTVRAFAPGRTREIKLRIHARQTRTGDSFAIRRLVVRRIGLDAHQREVRARIGEPVLASMASIPSRRTMLADAVDSLLAQCDRVRVFLNNYPDVPDFLLHPRVDVRRSQDWDDRGDAGKMFWLEHDKQPGYRLIVDDDLVFPPDFSDVMCGKVAARNKRAIYATHGVLLRQPVSNYYDNRSRAATFHFEHALPADRRVHIGATNALCLHSSAVSMHWDDFKYCNSADVWLALHAQHNDLQVLTPARRANWVRENRHAAPEETIYRHSLNRTRTRFDSSLVQDAVLKHHWPLTIKAGEDRKYALLLKLDTVDGLAAHLERCLALAASETAEWVVLLAYDRGDAALEEAVAALPVDRETHLIDTAKGEALAQAAGLMTKTGITALLGIEAAALATAPEGEAPGTGKPVSWGGLQMVRLRTGRRTAGAILAESRDDAATLLALTGDLRLKPASGRSAFATPAPEPRAAPAVMTGASGATINSVFEQVRVLNLDRRTDRWDSVSRSLALAGITAERFSAVDGSLPEVAAEYEAYLREPPVTVSDAVPPINSQRDFYMDYASQMARVAYLERDGRKAVASRGAWGYLRSYEAILEQALANNNDSLLVIEDDVMLHRNAQALFAEAMTQLPDDWLILQLGTLQYNWTPPWAEPVSPLLYRTNGSAIGSHAVGMRFDVIPYLLDQTKRHDMPYDVGALSAATRAFPDRCYVITPHLAIQSLVDSDIGTSDFQQGNKREDIAATYRWKLDDYQ
ncbi:glycosyltransferase family 25 protein [Hoeflea ulvae]|uniref:Glycosyltransferase family 25 protein n=1 Tax=Hoeflea ulvae TaxID=2983764 RepID=A0ABT3YKH2_9HYPH|nr:glycosyltransferase family 25 protein [Hoeflea ulvae]MCY0096395.1 glycosyltransferase family 25 protein [Hoeflea ulvae]